MLFRAWCREYRRGLPSDAQLSGAEPQGAATRAIKCGEKAYFAVRLVPRCGAASISRA